MVVGYWLFGCLVVKYCLLLGCWLLCAACSVGVCWWCVVVCDCWLWIGVMCGWLLVVGCWVSVVGWWLVVVGCLTCVVDCWLLVVSVNWWSLAADYWVLVVGCLVIVGEWVVVG